MVQCCTEVFCSGSKRRVLAEVFAAKQMPRHSLQTDFIGPKFRAVAIAVLSAFGALLFGLDIGQKHAD